MTQLGVVTQDAYPRSMATRSGKIWLYGRSRRRREEELIEALPWRRRIWDLISSLPNGLDTVAGNRGYRLSGGEKQRVAIARLLLKAPRVVVLDEATAHLDSESEAAIQRALKIALLGRTSLVIAHRLSTLNHPRCQTRSWSSPLAGSPSAGTHEELLAAGRALRGAVSHSICTVHARGEEPAATSQGQSGRMGP